MLAWMWEEFDGSMVHGNGSNGSMGTALVTDRCLASLEMLINGKYWTPTPQPTSK